MSPRERSSMKTPLKEVTFTTLVNDTPTVAAAPSTRKRPPNFLVRHGGDATPPKLIATPTGKSQQDLRFGNKSK